MIIGQLERTERVSHAAATEAERLMHSLTGKLVTGSAWAFTGKIASAFCGLAANAILARLLIPEALGAYFLTYSLVSIAALVAQLGLGQTVVRLVAESMSRDLPGRAAKSVRLVIRLGGLGVLIVAAALILGAGTWLAWEVFDSTLMAGVITLVPLWVAVTAFPNLLAEIFRGFHDIRLATLFGGVVTTVLNALLFAGLWLLQGHSSLEDVLILAIAAGTTNTLMAGIFLWRKIRPMEGNGQIATREVLTISWPLWLSNMTLFILTQADLWILGIYRAPDEVAVYGAAARLVMAVATPLIVANAVLPPIVAEMYTQDRKQELQRALRATATIAGIPTIAVLIVFMFFGAPIMGMVYGDFYRTGATVLVLLSLGHLVNAAAGSCGLVLMLTGHQMAMLRISLFSGVLAILAMLWAAPRYGPVGIAAVAATGMTLQNLLMLVTAHRRTQIWTHVDLRHLLAIPVVFRALRPSK